MTLLHIGPAFLLLFGGLHQVTTSGSCESTILEKLNHELNSSSSPTYHVTAKDVLKTFFLRINGQYRFNATKERRCKDKQITFEQFIDRTSRHLSKRTVCGSSYFRISVAALAIFLHLDRYVCGEHNEPYQRYLDQITHPDLLRFLSFHTRHSRNRTISSNRQCLNYVRLQRMLSMIREEQQHFQHQHSKRFLSSESPTSNGIKEKQDMFFTHLSNVTSYSGNITTLNTTESPLMSTFDLYHNNTDIHCFLAHSNSHVVCFGFNSNYILTSFHCSRLRKSDLYNCVKYRRNARIKLDNETLTLVLFSKLNTENYDDLISKLNLAFPLESLPWVIKYQTYKPLRLQINQTLTIAEKLEIPDTISIQNMANDLPKVMPTAKGRHQHKESKNSTLPQTDGKAKKPNQHESHNHVTQEEARAGLLVFAVIKEYLLQPSDLPCPSDVLHQLYSYFKNPNSQYLTFNDLQKKFQNFLDGTSVSKPHQTHSHQKRSLTKDALQQLSLKESKHQNTKYDHYPSQNEQDLHTRSGHQFEHHHHYSNPIPGHGHHENPLTGHGNQQPSRAHSNLCSRLFSFEHNERNDHHGESINKINWTISYVIHVIYNYWDTTVEFIIYWDTLTSVTSIYFGGKRTTIGLQDLHEMAPALLLLLTHGNEEAVSTHSEVTYMQSYGLGTLCVVFLSLASVLGAIFIKITGTKKKAYLLSFLLSLSVGCLLGDAILHLVPSVLGKHDHDNLGKLIILIATMYAFFLIQMIVSLFHRNHDHSQIFMKESQKSQEIHVSKNEIMELENKARKNDAVLNNTPREDNPMERQESNESQKDLTIEECPSESNVSTYDKDIIPAVWMVIIGDCVHNFADGLAIGATFTQSLTEGLSTAIAVLCHEVPHELGDFAILLAAGFTVKRAIVVNLLSSITAFVGLFIGISVGAEFKIWIIAAGAGMFLYISLGTMIPELVRIFRNNPCKEMFFSLNAGYIFGVVGMLLLAIYEEGIKIT
ncbi:zinc transporter ZIP10-like [Saccostrea cucullata]|uniref:zinc transporter ZIP10-like n=1 Tax=Saccostrea cuccullata TaxID=36930 RepID=UPI002ED4B423